MSKAKKILTAARDGLHREYETVWVPDYAETVLDMADSLLTDREALVRYVRALRALQKIRVHLLEVAENNAVWNEVIEAYEALSRELRDEIEMSEDV